MILTARVQDGHMAPSNNFFQNYEKKLFKRSRANGAFKKYNAHVELLPPLILAQIISLFPINGINEEDSSNLRFQWKSYKVLYCLFIMSFEIYYCVLTIKEYCQMGMTIVTFGTILFYGSSACMSFLFLRLARGWKDFIGQWVSVQDYMNGLQECNVRNKIKIITIWLTLSSVSEHVLANSKHSFGMRGDEMMIAHGLMEIVTKFIITMIWNYTDIFLTTVSLCLGKMFKQFALDLEATSKSVTPETSLSYWGKRREIYSRLSLLTKLVDEKFSILVLLSFTSNLYYICLQLLHTIEPMESITHMIYFCGSFGHLLCRTSAVCFAASSIYENSKQPLSVIFSVPSENFNIEVQRLQIQISSETLALTGCRFFTVTRTLILTIAGTIVTYEIVLFQFSRTQNDSDSANATVTMN